MLSPEAKAALMARLSESGTQDETPFEQPLETQVETQVETPIVDTSIETPEQESPVSPAQTPPPKMVPLEDLAKVRAERRQLREEVTKQREAIARLEGRLEARVQAPEASWVDEALAPEPEDEVTSFVRELKAERESQQSQALLNQVVSLCKEADPTLDDDFLLTQLAMKRTPEQAVVAWQSIKSKFAPPPVVQQTQIQPAPRAAPPTVERAPAVVGTPKPTSWGDVAKLVRQQTRGSK